MERSSCDMVLSLAFILAFIGASVALLVGIVIFVEVTDAMALTLPILSSGFIDVPVIIPDDTEATTQVFFKEHSPSSSPTILFSNPNSGISRIHDQSTANQGRTGYLLIPNVDAKYVDGETISIRWQLNRLSGSGTAFAHVEIWDGHFDGTNQTRWVALSPVVNVVVDTPITVSTTSQFGVTTSSSPLDTSSALEDEVTIAVILRNSGSHDSLLNLQQVRITDYVTWSSTNTDRLCTTVTYTKSSTLTDEADCTPIRNGIIIDPLAENATNTIPFGTPSSPTEFQQVATFNNALNIGLTVLGILPVALFFFLFMIFGGRVE